MKTKNAEKCRNEIKYFIVRTGMTMRETVELADVLGYEFVWQKRQEVK